MDNTQIKKPKVLSEETSPKRRNFYHQDETLAKLIEESFSGEYLSYVQEKLELFGESCANEIDERAAYTDRDGQPKLIPYDKYGEEISRVWVNEGYKQTVQETYQTGIVGYVHKNIPKLGSKGNYTYSFMQGYLLSQSEPGFYCPVTLTLATAYLLEHYADDRVKEMFMDHVCSTGETELYEGATFLTERQGGSDVGANLVRAVKEGDHYRLYGEKYFASNAGMCGVATVLARLDGAPEGSRGLSLFAVPWKRADGGLNGIKVRKLKDKLGVRAVPSGEVEFDGAKAYVIGEPERGFYYMMEALNLSRVCNAVASLGIMRRAYTEAFDYTSKRNAFGRRLQDYPMVQETLAQLKAKLHAEMLSVFDMIKLFEKAAEGTATEKEIVLNRLFIAMMKKETAEQAIEFCHEAIELHGGNGYIEDFVTPRLLRDAQVLTVWEGTENILGMELVRLVEKYDAHVIYLDVMKTRVRQLEDTTAPTEVLEAQLIDLEVNLNQFAVLDNELQTLKAKPLLKQMALLYEGVLAAEWAEKYQGKDKLLAEIYLEMNFTKRNIGDKPLGVKYFQEITEA